MLNLLLNIQILDIQQIVYNLNKILNLTAYNLINLISKNVKDFYIKQIIIY